MTKKSRKILIVSVVLVSVAIAVPLTVVHYSKPNFAKMSPRQIREYVDSNAFRDANGDARRQVFEQMGEAMQARMETEVKGYFALAEGEDRTAYLDKIIDEMQARRAEFMANRDPNMDPNRPFDPNRFGPPDANGRPRFGQRGQMAAGQRPRINPERNRARSSRMSADMRVKSAQFRRDLFNRMQQRGIQMPMGRPGGPGGGGGFGPGRGFGGPPG
jgi:hypothetical protein